MIEPDTTEDEHDEDFDRISALVDEFVDVLDEFGAEESEALMALNMVIGGILTQRVVSRDGALEMVGDLSALLRADIIEADEDGTAWWTKNRAN